MAAAISSQARRLFGEMSSPANRESLRSRTTTSDTASQGSRLSFSPTLLSLYIAISTEVLIAGDCVLLYVSQCTTVCWGLLCLHSGSIPAGFHHPGDPRYRPGSGADTCDTYATFYHQSNSLIFVKLDRPTDLFCSAGSEEGRMTLRRRLPTLRRRVSAGERALGERVL